jgi:SAM-dependent methyltransferase
VKPPDSDGPPCPVCGGATAAFLRRPSVPVHQNLLHADPAAARAATRGVLDLCLCAGCGFAFNAAFDPGLLDYGREYDNTQTFSASFAGHVDALVDDLVGRHGVRGCRVVEVGCGKGTFLKRLVARGGPGTTGLGFDPTYTGPETDLGGRVRFHRRFYDAGAAAAPADVVVCRHVIEHVPRPLELLRAVRQALGRSPAARVFFETPCLEWILRRRVTWDFFYEHCSLFTAGALAAAFARAGFAVTAVRKVFGEQYLWLEGRVTSDGVHEGAGAPRPTPHAPLVELARRCADEEPRTVAAWGEQLRRLRRRGPVALWGAGAKGVTFCNLADPDAAGIACVVDVNPAKQGQFVAGTGHPIVAPEQLAAAGVASVLVLNPNYLEEIAAQLARLRVGAAVVDLMRAA